MENSYFAQRGKWGMQIYKKFTKSVHYIFLKLAFNEWIAEIGLLEFWNFTWNLCKFYLGVLGKYLFLPKLDSLVRSDYMRISFDKP